MTQELTKKILSDITVHMKYAKYLPTSERRETWKELVTRNMRMHMKIYPQLKDEIKKNYKLSYIIKLLNVYKNFNVDY